MRNKPEEKRIRGFCTAAFYNLASLAVVSLARDESVSAPSISIVSPLPIPYQTDSVLLTFGANVLEDAPVVVYLAYSLDGQPNVTETNIGRTGIQQFGS